MLPFGELESGVLLRPWMPFHKFRLTAFDIVFWSEYFQLLTLTLLIVSFALRHLFLTVLIDGKMERIALLDFSAHMWVGTRLLIIVGFSFANVK